MRSSIFGGLGGAVLAALAALTTACTTNGGDAGAAAASEGAVEQASAEQAPAEAAFAPAIAPVRWRGGASGERSRLSPSDAGPSEARCVDGPAPHDAVAVDRNQESDGARLLVQRGDAWLAMPLQKTRFDTIVVGTVAETTVTQVFHNPFSETIEALYTFPLADDGAVDDYAITVGTKRIRGEMKRRGEAREIYEKAKAEGKSAGLLEQQRTNIFAQSLANIPPGQSVEVTIHVVQPVHQEKGRMELALPTVVGERYISAEGAPHAASLSAPARPAGAVSCADLEVSVAIEAGDLGIQGLDSKFHAVDVDRQEDGVLVELAKAGELLNRDFVLSWSLRGEAPGASLIAQADRDGDGGYFTLTIAPPEAVKDEQIRGRELIFVIDSSGSMRGAPLDAAKATVEHALASMRPEDTFQILNFSSGVSSLGKAPVANTAVNRERGRVYLEKVLGMGGTEMLSGIRGALGMRQAQDRLRMVLFLTDGYIGDEQAIFTALEESIGDARLFSLGVGSSVNRHLLEGMARFGRGAVTYMGPEESPKVVVDRFYERIDSPVLTDIGVDWGDLKVDAVLPGKIPDLFAGQPVVVFGRYEGAPSGTIHLEGKLGGEAVRIPVTIDFSKAENASGLASMWARKQIDEWLGSRRFRDDRDKMRELVTELAIERRIMTEYTSFVAVGEEVVAQADGSYKTVTQAVETPEGVVAGAEVGESFGVGGLGLVGTGRGGGGGGAGTIGLGNIGVIGKGGGGGTGSGYGRGGGADFGGRGARVPRVRQAKALVSGSLDRDIIRRIIRAHINEVRHCYNQGLQRDPKLAGRLAIKFKILGTGAVAKEVEIETSIGDEKVDQCVSKALRRWKFPKPEGGGEVVVTYPFLLEPG
ncbi:MAG: VIT domain-containing protein [Nannocystaceae bacterium]